MPAPWRLKTEPPTRTRAYKTHDAAINAALDLFANNSIYSHAYLWNADTGYRTRVERDTKPQVTEDRHASTLAVADKPANTSDRDALPG